MKTKINLIWEIHSNSAKEGRRHVILEKRLSLNIDYMIPTYIEYLNIKFNVFEESTLVIPKDGNHNYSQLTAHYCEELPFLQPIFNDNYDQIIGKENAIDKKVKELLDSDWIVTLDYKKNTNKENEDGSYDK